MDGIRFCVCGCQSENPFLCFCAKPTQRACARDLPRDRKDKGKKVREKIEENSQQRGAEKDSRYERSTKRRRQSSEGPRRGQSGDESRAERRTVKRSQKGS